MKEHTMIDINKLVLRYYDKCTDDLWQIRTLWDDVFKDPADFTDYYFTDICEDNRILLAEYNNKIVGMIHLNPYSLCRRGANEKTYYIVGVAVRMLYRQYGIMKRMMQKALQDAKEESIRYLFLMPKKQEYYLGFGFRQNFYTKILEFADEDVDSADQYTIPNTIEMKLLSDFSPVDRELLAEEMNHHLDICYDTYIKRDKKYIDRLSMEHLCQNGNVVIVYSKQQLCGYFSFDLYDGEMYVERFAFLSSHEQDISMMFSTILKVGKQYGVVDYSITLSEHFYCLLEPWLPQNILQNTKDGYGIMAIAFDANGDLLPEIETKDAKKIQETTFFDEIV